jgi:hypothetical protein
LEHSERAIVVAFSARERVQNGEISASASGGVEEGVDCGRHRWSGRSTIRTEAERRSSV